MNEPVLLRPLNLQSAVTIDQARDIVAVITSSTDADEIADALEAAASDSDLAHAVMFALVCRLNGWPDQTGVEIVASSYEPHAGDLWTP